MKDMIWYPIWYTSKSTKKCLKLLKAKGEDWCKKGLQSCEVIGAEESTKTKFHKLFIDVKWTLSSIKLLIFKISKYFLVV